MLGTTYIRPSGRARRGRGRQGRQGGMGKAARHGWCCLASHPVTVSLAIFNRDYSDGYRMGNAVTLLLIGYKMGCP